MGNLPAGNTGSSNHRSGRPGTCGELPIIDGSGATTRSALNYWNENRAVIKIGGANVPADTLPKFITLGNLDIRSARPPYTFVAANAVADGDIFAFLHVYRGCIVDTSLRGLPLSWRMPSTRIR